MTSTERTAIEKLREEVHNYHVEVKELVTRCEACREDAAKLNADIYGLPGKKDTSPGLMGDVADLKRSRRMMLYAVRGAWALLTGLLGMIAAKCWPT